MTFTLLDHLLSISTILKSLYKLKRIRSLEGKAWTVLPTLEKRICRMTYMVAQTFQPILTNQVTSFSQFQVMQPNRKKKTALQTSNKIYILPFS